jgi:hypothetical protein
MRNDTTKRLAVERRQRLDDAARKLLDENDVEGANAALTWVETSSKVLSVARQVSRRRWAIGILAFCLIVLGLAWTLRMTWMHVTLDVSTQNVIMGLSDSWESGLVLQADRVIISRLAEVNAPGLRLVAKMDPAQETMWLEIQKNTLASEPLTLTGLTFHQPADLELSLRNGELWLFVKNSAISGIVSVRQAEMTVNINTIIEKRSIDLADDDPPETIHFTTANMGELPVQIRITTQDAWRLRGLQVESLGFVEEYPPGSGDFESVIQSGTVTILETDTEETLRLADTLRLKDPKSRRLELSTSDEGIRVLFEGIASEILVGPQDFPDNLTPTVFEYVYHQQRLKAFWVALLFLFGLVWKIRNSLIS